MRIQASVGSISIESTPQLIGEKHWCLRSCVMPRTMLTDIYKKPSLLQLSIDEHKMLLIPLAHSLVLGQLFRLLTPIVLASAIVSLCSTYAKVTVPTWLVVLVAALAIPTYHIGRSELRSWRNIRKAARLGATMPVRWDGKMPGNLDHLHRINEEYWNGYLGEFSYRICTHRY